MEKTIQFIGTSPDELEEKIYNRIKNELEILKKEFMPREPTEFLTRNEVRNMLKVDLSTIHNWQKKGKLKAYGCSGRVYFKRSEVVAAIQPLTV